MSHAKSSLWSILLLGFVVLSAGMGLRDPWPSDEPRFALVAKEMVESGNWWFPSRGGDLYPDKPPVFIWMSAFFYWLTASTIWSFLIPSLLAGLGTITLVYDLTRRLWNRRTAAYASLILLTLLQFSLQAKKAQIDGLLCFWTTLGLYGFCRHLFCGPDWKWYALGGLACGVGVITKGVGILPYFLFLSLIVQKYYPYRYLTLPQSNTFKWLLAPAATLIAISFWLLPMLYFVAQSGDPAMVAYRDNILFHQTATRYANAWHHLHPWYFYLLEVLPWAWFPVSFLIPWIWPAWWRRVQKRDGRILLLGFWVITVIVFFSISPGKRGVYMLPITPVIAILTASVLPLWWRKVGVHRLSYAGLYFFCLCIAGALIYVACFAHQGTQGYEYLNSSWLMTGLLLYGAFALWLTIWPGWAAPVKLAALLWCFWLFMGFFLNPVLNDYRSGKAMMNKVSELIPKAQIAILDWREQMLLQAQQNIVHFGYSEPKASELKKADEWIKNNPDTWILLPAHYLESCKTLEKPLSVGFYHRNNWFLIRGCQLSRKLSPD